MKQELLPSLDLFRHHCPLQIRFNDIDILGHTNNTVYFSFYDTGKAHYFNAVRGEKMKWRRVDTIIANVNNAFIEPILFGYDIEVYTRCLSIHEKSFRLQQALVRKSDMKIMSLCETVMVSYDPDTHTTRPLPDDWREDLCRYEGRDLSIE